MRNKDFYNLLEIETKSQIEDDQIEDHIKKFCVKDYYDIDVNQIKKFLADKIIFNPSNKVTGQNAFNHTEFIIGVTQFIDNIVMKYGIDGIQVFKNDYTYYQRLDPNIKFAQIGNLDPNKPLVISMPFAGHCDVHKEMNVILDECQEKNIDVHLDCAWLTCAEGIEFNFNHPCIKSFASSLSKAYALGWNRIGIRWSKEIDETDSITIYNRHNMYNKSLVMIGYHVAKKFPINFYWQKYKDLYYQACRETYTFPTKIIWLSRDLHGQLYGVSKLLAHLHNISVTN